MPQPHTCKIWEASYIIFRVYAASLIAAVVAFKRITSVSVPLGKYSYIKLSHHLDKLPSLVRMWRRRTILGQLGELPFSFCVRKRHEHRKIPLALARKDYGMEFSNIILYQGINKKMDIICVMDENNCFKNKQLVYLRNQGRTNNQTIKKKLIFADISSNEVLFKLSHIGVRVGVNTLNKHV